MTCENCGQYAPHVARMRQHNSGLWQPYNRSEPRVWLSICAKCAAQYRSSVSFVVEMVSGPVDFREILFGEE